MLQWPVAHHALHFSVLLTSACRVPRDGPPVLRRPGAMLRRNGRLRDASTPRAVSPTFRQPTFSRRRPEGLQREGQEHRKPSSVRIPGHSVHPFRSNPYTDSDVFVHPLRRNS